MKQLRIAYLEPFYGGSHKAFVNNLIAYSHHSIVLVSLPDRFWKWRTRGAALEFYRRLPNPGEFDVIVTSDMVNVAELQGLWKTRVPLVQYMHENQLTYPLENESEPDANHIMTDLLSVIAADRVVFNSQYHMTAFLQAAAQFAARMPDCRPGWAIPGIEAKSEVLYPGIVFAESPGSDEHRTSVDGEHGPVLLWSQRWEYDKQPHLFSDLLNRLHKQNVPFQLILLGDRAASPHPSLVEIERRYASRILFSGHTEDRAEYVSWLRRAHVVVSTALQETFGIAALEAMQCGCAPLFPHRLSYPEIVPESLHQRCLYQTVSDACERIADWKPLSPEERAFLQTHVESFNIVRQTAQFDAFFERVAAV